MLDAKDKILILNDANFEILVFEIRIKGCFETHIRLWPQNHPVKSPTSNVYFDSSSDSASQLQMCKKTLFDIKTDFEVNRTFSSEQDVKNYFVVPCKDHSFLKQRLENVSAEDSWNCSNIFSKAVKPSLMFCILLRISWSQMKTLRCGITLNLFI